MYGGWEGCMGAGRGVGGTGRMGLERGCPAEELREDSLQRN